MRITARRNRGGGDLDAQLQARSLEMVNELSNRRRLHLLFANPQPVTHGVQKSYVNVGKGNLTFIQRDLVRVSHIPLVAGRVYDSDIEDGADFGPGWKFAMAEVIVRQSGNRLLYVDANNGIWLLRDSGNQLEFEGSAPTGRLKISREGQTITVKDDRLTRAFEREGDRYLLSRLEDRSGIAIEYDYEGGLLSAIRTAQGRFIAIERSAQGRILSITDDAGQWVEYTYNPNGLLVSSSLMSGKTLQYRYDAGGRLASIIDPRGVSVLTASFDDQARASEVSVLGNLYRIRYEQGRTTVSDTRDVSSVFEQDDTGRTVAVTDNTGAVTKLAIDPKDGEPTTFEVNGVPLAMFTYDQKGMLERIHHSGADSQSETVFSYTPSGMLQAIHSDGTEIARYAYGRRGQLSEAWSAETGQLNMDWNDLGQPASVQFEDTAIQVGHDAHGRVTRFDRGHGQNLQVSYDARDRVVAINRGDAGSAAYTYAADKFRTSSIYDGQDTVVYAYDAAGNVRGFAYENADGSHREDEYIVGERNELQKVISSHNPEFEFGYDTLGRATLVSAAGRELQIEYDEQSRVTRTIMDGRVTMEADYAENAFDVAHHEDSRTFRSRATQRPGSGILGSIHEIVYTRPLYTPWQAVTFDGEMNRFVLHPVTDAYPERLLLDGFARRNLPLTPDNSHGAITHLDKPSSALFVPPELVSANCFVCNVVIYGHVLTINDQSSATLNEGEYGVFKSSAFATGCQYETGPPPPFQHTLDYDDGDLAGTISYPPFYANAHAYDEPGSFEPVATMRCLCGVFGYSWASAEIVVPPTIEIDYNMFIPLDHVRLPTWLQVPPQKFYGGDGVPSLESGHFRIRQVVSWYSGTGQLSSNGYSGLTKEYLVSSNLSSTTNCYRKNCPECPKYPPFNEDIVHQGKCKTGTHVDQALADDMSSIVASVSEESEDSLTIQFSGQPANALSSAPGVFEDLDWNHELVVDWSGENIQCTLNYQHDGFPFHDIRINEEIVYQFDPIENDQTPLSLAGTGSGEWQDSVDCSEALK